MTLFRTFFRSHKSEADGTSRPRRTWPRLRRSQSAAVVLDAHLQLLTPTADASPVQTGSDETDSAASERPAVASTRAGQQSSGHDNLTRTEDNDAAAAEPSHKSNDSNELSRFPQGSKRLKTFVNRLRPRKSYGPSCVSESLQPTGLQDGRENANTDPVKEDPFSQTQSTVDAGAQEQNRSVSARTVQSEESNHTTITVCRHPSRHIPLPVQELGEDWFVEGFMTYGKHSRETTHLSEASDPFSDGKIADAHRRSHTSSRCSDDPVQRKSEATQRSKRRSQAETSHHTVAKSHSEHSSHNSHSSHPASTALRDPSSSSQSSRSSRMSRLDPTRAREAFNTGAVQFNPLLFIPSGDAATTEAEEKPTRVVDNTLERRRRFLGRIHPVQSHLTLGSATPTPTPAPKLRRTKTFASLVRRPEPMTSLRGKSIETIARLGGYSFIVLPPDLAPCPLQLPASIVATVVYLRRFGVGARAADLFVEPGNVKKAIRLYECFARHVLIAAKDEPRIALTMRVIAMPIWENEEEGTPILSTAWVLKAILAGLPGGILGSAQLYKTLKDIYHTESVHTAARTRLIALAIVALTSEMQCALICAVFGLLTALLQSTERDEPRPAGTPVRPVASMSKADRLVRVFGPLLTGSGPRDQTVQPNVTEEVEREIAEERVAGMLVEHWRGISHQLRAWTSGYHSSESKRE
ncbi:uncharacterized protein N7482_007129 [Penicillium canariense]|uniref:Rho-GAP domain-containing protein n=1 Tax=Penicillium canariense TaxID=189055 RepID=A0A9W9HYY9_9EURO|nr:uncharacterized protein N7482_007129 [Penicillium canariense]KAJ5160125.1 hypothetical protein N7482_007129 [Penicillium canariense]